ncbi:MAG: patatin-like phospholipase family protein [Bacteroidales bacterium]|nr:patatin-like phospholipase family protein [Bacteroidales bacterium]
MSFNKVTILLFTFFTTTMLFSQEEMSESKPKIGLVLSGGGAKGLAHIGVLQVLEEAGIKPDYITGTSMGSIIGGLYSMGYTAEEISEINRNTDWAALLSDDLPLNKIVMQEKLESDRYLLSFPIRNYAIKLPSGFIQGQQLESMFSEKSWPLTEKENFDSLPIPFRCYSVDLITAKTIEHKSGDIVEAMRASMSIPSVFAPKDIDTLLLVDGGVTTNFPVQKIRDMGADFVIGVYVGTNENQDKEDLFAFTDVLNRTIFIGSIMNSREQTELADVLITPDLKGLGSSDFRHSQLIEQYGMEAALKVLPQLEFLADSLQLSYHSVRRFNANDTIKIKNIKVEGLRFLSDNYVVGKSRIKQGSEVSQDAIAKAIENIYGTQVFAKVTYSLIYAEDGYTLVFNAKEKTRAFMQYALHYENKRGIGLVGNLTLRNWAIPSSNFVFSIDIAENPGLRTSLTKFVGLNQRSMLETMFEAHRDKIGYYNTGIEFGSYIRSTSCPGLKIKNSFGLNSEAGIYGTYNYLKLEPHTNLQLSDPDANFDSYTSHGSTIGAYYSHISTDRLYYPTKGVITKLAAEYYIKPAVFLHAPDTVTISEDSELLNSDASTTFFGQFRAITTIWDKLTIDWGVTSGLCTNQGTMARNFFLGGAHFDRRQEFIPMAGYYFGELLVRNFTLGQFNLRYQIMSGIYLTANSNVVYHNDNFNDYFNSLWNANTSEFAFGFNGGVQYDSPFGPLQLVFGGNDKDNKGRWYLSLGYPF